MNSAQPREYNYKRPLMIVVTVVLVIVAIVTIYTLAAGGGAGLQSRGVNDVLYLLGFIAVVAVILLPFYSVLLTMNASITVNRLSGTVQTRGIFGTTRTFGLDDAKLNYFYGTELLSIYRIRDGKKAFLFWSLIGGCAELLEILDPDWFSEDTSAS